MHIEPRNGASIDRVYLHKNEGPEQEGGAVGLGNYLDTIDGGYHKIVDDKVTVVKAQDDEIVWGEGGDNLHALAICDVGWSSETAAQYASDPFSIAEFERTAQEVAAWCKLYGIPIVHVAPGAPGQAPTERGIAEHADDHDPASEGHTDPGPAYPIAALVSRVAAIDTADRGLEQLVVWFELVSKFPLQPGESSWGVTALKQMLDKIGEGPGNDAPYFGQKLAACVVAFKKKHGIANVDPGFGGVAAEALLKLL